MEILVIPLQGNSVIQIYTSVSCEFNQYESIPAEIHIPSCDLKQLGSRTKAKNYTLNGRNSNKTRPF